ncbi:hypothetical protein [Bacillus thuringiensis]|uniref:hypothetical protein n=1 Tax=Bacillus thuringiensis TaxID=1428 RepID=UPI000BFA3596|nr:hypothetical protein [Bacillus thuringiensis]PFD55831.1 hypothetical protein CN274_24825 [Bacillus thuringiensis]
MSRTLNYQLLSEGSRLALRTGLMYDSKDSSNLNKLPHFKSDSQKNPIINILNDEGMEVALTLSKRAKIFDISSTIANRGSEQTSKSSYNEGDECNSDILNKEAIQKLNKSFLNMIRNDTFESGYSSSSEEFVKSVLKINPIQTKEELNSIFLKNFHDEKILIGILHIISHIEYEDIFPQGQTIALAALSHRDIEVREYAIRSFENWGNGASLPILKNVAFSEKWLQDYVDEVISDLEEELD